MPHHDGIHHDSYYNQHNLTDSAHDREFFNSNVHNPVVVAPVPIPTRTLHQSGFSDAHHQQSRVVYGQPNQIYQSTTEQVHTTPDVPLNTYNNYHSETKQVYHVPTLQQNNL